MKNVTILLLIFWQSGLWAQNSEHQSYYRTIYFGGGSYEIDEEQILNLYQLIDSIPHIERYQISISSHTDNIGGRAYNQWLSEMRSQAVVDYLLLKKISPENIFIRDEGQENPLFDNNSFDGRIRNRRVDIVFSPLVL